MEEILDYIESYFQRIMPESERRNFEKKCKTDKSFAEAVAWYTLARNAAGEELLQQKKKEWSESGRLVAMMPERKFTLKKIFPYAAAASVIIAVALYFLLQGTSPQQLADAFISKNYTTLSQRMDATNDTMQLARSEYNAAKYDEAAAMFAAYAASHTDNSEAKTNAGLAYLQLKKYDEAIAQFDALIAMTGLYSNPGKLLKAVTLMERNGAGDKDKAKELLTQVISENLDGKEKAQELLDKL